MHAIKTKNSFINIIDFRQIEYFLFVNNNSFEFIKIIGKKSSVVLQKTEYKTFSFDIFSDYLIILQQKQLLFGQPVNIILNLSSSYTYIKDMQGSNLSEIQNSMKLFTDKEYDVKFSILTSKKTKLFVYQAIKKEIIDSVLKSIENNHVNCLQISTLQLALLSQVKLSKDKNAIHSFTLFNKNYHMVQKDNNNIFVIDSQSDLDMILDSIFSGIKFNKYSVNDSALILSKLNKNFIKKLSYTTANSQKSQYLHAAQNSLKLLCRVAFLIFVLLLVTTGVSSLLSSESEIISEYQLKYSKKQAIIQQIDSLQLVISEYTKDKPKTIKTASILSAFCQKSYNNLYLTKISINNKLDDSLLVEAKGSAKNEDLIFRYQKESIKHISPFKLSLNTIKPEITHNRGLVDTNITFIFRTVINK